MQRGPGRDHWVDRVFLFDLEINQHWAVVPARRLHGWDDFGALRHRHASYAISFGKLDEIGVQQGSRLIVALVEKLLPLPHHAQESIVDDSDVDLEVLLNNGCKFRHG